VFFTRFSWFGRYAGIGGLPFGTFEVAIVVRTAVLLWCLAGWIRQPATALPEIVGARASVAPVAGAEAAA
jgi:hypothetical protein